MKGVIKVICIGTLGRDPEVKTFQNGGSICTFSAAVNESWTGKDGQKQEHTEWVNIVANGKLGEICAQYLRKGSKVYIEGKLRTRKWQGQDGSDRYSTEVIASEMQMLDGKPDSGAQNSGYAPQQQQRSAPAPQHAPQEYRQPAQKQAPAFDDFNDDIPFN